MRLNGLENNHRLQLFWTICYDLYQRKRFSSFYIFLYGTLLTPHSPTTDYREIFAPFTFALSPSLLVGEFKSSMQIPMFRIISVSGPIQDEAKFFNSIDGRKLQVANITLYIALLCLIRVMMV